MGRTGKGTKGPRTIDIDIILYEGVTVSGENLTLPHPRAFERDFVVLPLLEIKPGLKSLIKKIPLNIHHVRRLEEIELES